MNSVNGLPIGRIIWTYFLSFLGLGSLLFINFYPFTWHTSRPWGWEPCWRCLSGGDTWTHRFATNHRFCNCSVWFWFSYCLQYTSCIPKKTERRVLNHFFKWKVLMPLTRSRSSCSIDSTETGILINLRMSAGCYELRAIDGCISHCWERSPGACSVTCILKSSLCPFCGCLMTPPCQVKSWPRTSYCCATTLLFDYCWKYTIFAVVVAWNVVILVDQSSVIID